MNLAYNEGWHAFHNKSFHNPYRLRFTINNVFLNDPEYRDWNRGYTDAMRLFNKWKGLGS